MPIIQVSMVKGRTAQAKAELIHRLTEATVAAIGAPRETIRVLLHELPPEHWGVGGVLKSERDEQGEAR